MSIVSSSSISSLNTILYIVNFIISIYFFQVFKMPKHRESESDHSNAKSDAEDSGSEEEYVVEKIVDKRLKNGKVSRSEKNYFVKQHGLWKENFNIIFIIFHW